MALALTNKTVLPPPAWNVAQVSHGFARGQYWPISAKTTKGGKALRSLSGAKKIWADEVKTLTTNPQMAADWNSGLNPFTLYVPIIRTAGTPDQLYNNLDTILSAFSTKAPGQSLSRLEEIEQSQAVTSGAAQKLAAAVTRYRDPNFYNSPKGKFYAYLIYSGFTPLSINAPLSTIGQNLYNSSYLDLTQQFINDVTNDSLLKKSYEAKRESEKPAGQAKAPKAKKDINLAVVWADIESIAAKGVSRGTPVIMAINGAVVTNEKKVSGGRGGGGGIPFATKWDNMLKDAAHPKALINVATVKVNEKGVVIGGTVKANGVTRNTGHYYTLSLNGNPNFSRMIAPVNLGPQVVETQFKFALRGLGFDEASINSALASPGVLVSLSVIGTGMGSSPLMVSPAPIPNASFALQQQPIQQQVATFQQNYAPNVLSTLPQANALSPRSGMLGGGGLGGLPSVMPLNSPGPIGTPGSQGLGNMFATPIGLNQ